MPSGLNTERPYQHLGKIALAKEVGSVWCLFREIKDIEKRNKLFHLVQEIWIRLCDKGDPS